MGADERTLVKVGVAGGRELEVLLRGPEDDVPVFFHHGKPDAAGMFDPLADLGAERNLRHITCSRPDYGGSGRLARPSVASSVDDLVAIADALGYERFYSVGGSSGGPRSIVCAALLGDRMISAAAIASPGPLDADGLEWTAGIGKGELGRAGRPRRRLRVPGYLEGEGAKMSAASPEKIRDVLGDLVSEADRRAISGADADNLAGQFARSGAGGVWAWFDDHRALFKDWGFALEDIRASPTIWHGARDCFAPIANGCWLAEHTDDRAELRPRAGHLSLTISSYGPVLDGLLGLASLRR